MKNTRWQRTKKWCWVAQERERGWKLGFATEKTYWIPKIIFENIKAIKVITRGNVVFIHSKICKCSAVDKRV